ncbi:hypothetical protein SAE02_41670 [Skermanella aerolata]|uniref:PLAT domain-containing protein n=1 Tax=Skermanella aerolata TaxID=393310 RepID=A0A512DU66_9PROT|nr:hypothetical protein SAE02_41670 [Skermanella aerolata]
MASGAKNVDEVLGPTEEILTRGYRISVGAEPETTDAVVYQVAVYTGDIPDAGSDADIWLWIDDTAGRSDWRHLDSADDKVAL